ncbi:MAG: hypothetical protein E7662_06900 [Ruminococcaceae bacterium]|nr:hypothetical protein [Oscillospiraceae bacterium]
MRNKVFITVFASFLLLVMISAPAKRVLCAAGLIVNENVGNIIEVEKVYDPDSFAAPLLNGIEEAKREITDIYTNYIPFYVDITSIASTFTQSLNNPITALLLEAGNRDVLERMEAAKENTPSDTTVPAETTGVPDTTAPAVTDAVTSGNAETTSPPETETTAPETTAPETEPPFSPTYNATYLKSNNQHRYYQIDAQTEKDGPKMSFYVRIPSATNDKLRPTMEKQLEKINGFATEVPGVNWYVYAATCFEDTALCDLILPSESKRVLFEEFFEKLDPSVQRGWVKVDTIEDKYNKFFRTDHHWNVYGYTEAYRSVVEMFKENYSDITLREPEIVSFPAVTFYGSNATATARYTISDPFAVASYDLPPHDIVMEHGVSYNSKIEIATNMENYLKARHNTKRTYGHYTAFQPILEEVTYPENKTGRVLLFIGDSYSPPLMEPLASYFDKTYIRYIDSNPTLENIDLAEYIKEKGITDVLLLEMSDRIIYDYYGDSLRGLK